MTDAYQDGRRYRWLQQAGHASWQRPWLGSLIAAGIVVVWGAVVGRWTPRGPLSSSQVLWSVLISVVLGAVAGFTTKSRWMMLAAPALFLAVVEIARSRVDGPTVAGVHLSTYGFLAFATGRGFHALVSWMPMLLGVVVGVAVARGVSGDNHVPAARRWLLWVRRSSTALAAMVLVVFCALIARPAHTAVIVDEDGRRVPGSIAELTRVEIGGHSLAMMIRGYSTDNPVLLFLAGGPGGSELGAMRRHLPDLEQYFTVVTWDQRGAGKSYPQLDPTSTLTLEGAIDDTVAVTNYLRDRFDQDQVFLVGQSWGSILGVLAVQQHPELYRAFIGVGQMVSPLSTDNIFYEDTLAWARDRGDQAMVDQLTGIGPPPYSRMFDYETALSHEHEVYPYDHTSNSEGEGGFSENLLVEEYTLVEQVHLLGAFLDTFSVIYPQIQGVDLRLQADSLDVPVYFVQGRFEAPGRSRPFEEWSTELEAPIKDVTVLERSGHRPMFEQPEEFIDYMVDTVLAQNPAGAR